jgi:hypothetical protein
LTAYFWLICTYLDVFNVNVTRVRDLIFSLFLFVILIFFLGFIVGGDRLLFKRLVLDHGLVSAVLGVSLFVDVVLAGLRVRHQD